MAGMHLKKKLWCFSVKLKSPSLKRSTDSSRTEVTGEQGEDSEAVDEEVFCLVYKHCLKKEITCVTVLLICFKLQILSIVVLFQLFVQDQVKVTTKAMVATMGRTMGVTATDTTRAIMITLGMTIRATITKIMDMDKVMMNTMVSLSTLCIYNANNANYRLILIPFFCY